MSRVGRGTAGRVLGMLAALALFGAPLGCGGSEAESTGARDLALVAAPEALLRVRTEPVRRARLSDLERVTGTVRAFHRASLTAETTGRVEDRLVEAGAAVEKDDPILELESSRQELELRRAVASVEAAETVLAHAERELARGERLIRQSVLSEQRRDELQHAVDRARDDLALARVARDAAQRDLEDTRIRAPFAGRVDSIAVDVGDYVVPGTSVATLVDLSRVRIFAGVTADEANRLVPGLSAQVHFAALGGQSFEATLVSVGRVANASDGTYSIELWLEDAKGLMRDGLVARIDLPDPNQEDVLMAPRAALLRRDGRSEAFVVQTEKGRSVARSREVRTGRNDGQWIEILAGLEDGDEVVVDGQFALEDGSRVVVDGDLSPVERSSASASPSASAEPVATSSRARPRRSAADGE